MSMPPEIQKFRTAMQPMAIFIFMGVMFMLIFMLLWLILIHGGWHMAGRALAIGSAFAAVYSVLCSWLLAFIFPSGFSAAGVYSHSFWGRRRFVAWQDISRVQRFCFLNLSYLRLYTLAGKVAWLPLFQSQAAGFCQEIRKFAPPDSPLLKQL